MLADEVGLDVRNELSTGGFGELDRVVGLLDGGELWMRQHGRGSGFRFTFPELHFAEAAGGETGSVGTEGQRLHDIAIWIAYSLMGLGAVLVDLYRKNELSFKKAVITTAFGLISGFLTFHICKSLGWWNQMGYIVPIGTMGGYKIIPWLIDYSPELIQKIINKKVDEK